MSLSRRSLLTFLTTSGLSGMYAAYSMTFGRWLAPSEAKLQPPRPSAPAGKITDNDAAVAERYLRAQKWAAKAKIRLKTPEAIVYADRMDPDERKGTIRFEPFAMVWHGKTAKSKSRPPLALVSDAAVVQFERAFDLKNPDPGRIVGGACVGPVIVQGPEGLILNGRNFVLERPTGPDTRAHVNGKLHSVLRLRSDNPVRFQFQKNSGKADGGAQVDLWVEENDGGKTQMKVVGIKSLRLRRNVSLNLAYEDKKTKAVTPVSVKCAGWFEYRVRDHVATFQDDVTVSRPTGVGEKDSLSCETLTLQFKEKAKPESQQRREARFGRQLEFVSLRATGPRVVLISEENDLRGEMMEFTYNIKEMRLGCLSPQEVVIQRAGNQFRCQQAALTHDAENQVRSVICQGAGSLKGVDETTQMPVFTASWSDWLRQAPTKRTGEELLEIHGNVAAIDLRQAARVDAGMVKFWFNRVAKQKKKAGQPASRFSLKSTDAIEAIRPQRLLAEGNVTMTAAEYVATTDRLEMWFRIRPASSFPQRNGSLTRRDPAGPARAGKKPNPVRLQGRKVQVIAAVSDGRKKLAARVEQAWVLGGVTVSQNDPVTRATAWSMNGGWVHITNKGTITGSDGRSRDNYHVEVHGFQKQNAVVRDLRGGANSQIELAGPKLTLDLASNNAAVIGPGSLKLPVDQDLQGKKLAVAQQLDVTWKDRMTFDGKDAKFFRDVSATLDGNRLDCRNMSVGLSKPIEFVNAMNGKGRRRGQIDLQRIHCTDGVRLLSREIEGQKLNGLRKANFEELTIDRATNKTEIVGKGVIEFWRRGDGRRGGLAPRAVSKPNQAGKSRKTQWEYARLNFAGVAKGRVDRRSMTFRDGVTVVYGPVASPLQTIDMDALPKEGGWMRCKELQFEFVEVKGKKKDGPSATGLNVNGYVRLMASGNAYLESKTFTARADTISFDESRGLYTLRSLGNRMATLWRESAAGNRDRVDVQWAEFVPSKPRLRLHRTTGGGLGN